MEVRLLSVGTRGFFLTASRLAIAASPLNSVAPNEKKTSGTRVVSLFQPRSIFFFRFCGKRKIFLAPSTSSLSSFFSSSPLYLPHLHVLFPPCSPNIPTCNLFISMLTLGALNHRPLVFLWIHVLMPNH